jgi:hypothetical protein
MPGERYVDLSSAFKSEVFRPLVTLIVPGAAASWPYVLVARAKHKAIGTFWNDHTTAALIIIAIASIAAGRILEALGSRVEVQWDRLLERKSGTHSRDWYRYLRLTLREEPIGQRYIRTVTLALKFELAMVFALPIMYVGICWLETELNLWTRSGLVGLGVAIVLLSAYLLYESYGSAGVLARVRQELVEQFYEPPARSRDPE